MEAVLKQRRSVIKRNKKEAEKAAKVGSVATLKNVPTSNRKMRLVADLIRGKKVNHALSILKFQAKQGAARLEKLLLSAISDWQAKNESVQLEEADLYIKGIFVDGGRILKRLRPAPQGRAHRVRKRSNHVTLTVDSLKAIKAVKTEVVSEKPVKEKKTTKGVKASDVKDKKSTKKTDNK